MTVWAFWPSYFARLFEQPTLLHHAHGIVLALWLGMLVVQAQLIRTQRRSWHRQLGKLSYVVAPAVVVDHDGVRASARFAPGSRACRSCRRPRCYFLALTLLSLVAFAVFYGLAIARRRDSQTHARWMVCTVFPMVTPVTDRLIGAHLPQLDRLVPRIEGTPILPSSVSRPPIYCCSRSRGGTGGRTAGSTCSPSRLGVLLVYHVGTLTLHRVPLWNAFCAWFLGLPLS